MDDELIKLVVTQLINDWFCRVVRINQGVDRERKLKWYVVVIVTILVRGRQREKVEVVRSSDRNNISKIYNI